jgi:type III restriction enzyme
MPETDTVTNMYPSSYRNNLYEDIEVGSLNSLEQKVVRILDTNKHVLWWARNKAKKGWYAIQGWQRDKIRPDFVVARKTDDGKLEFVYVIESKGEQLTGNADTIYKDAVLTVMSNLDGGIKVYQPQQAAYKLNDRFEFELVPQGDEERMIRTKLG